MVSLNVLLMAPIALGNLALIANYAFILVFFSIYGNVIYVADI